MAKNMYTKLFVLLLCCGVMSTALPMHQKGPVEPVALAQEGGFPVVKVALIAALGGLGVMGVKKLVDYSENCNLTFANGINCVLSPEQAKCHMMVQCLAYKTEKAALDITYTAAKNETSSELERLKLWLAYQVELGKLRSINVVQTVQGLVGGR